MKFQFFVFSYNRGIHLINCVMSIIDNVNYNYEIYVLDDISQDPLTKIYLKLIAEIPNTKIIINKDNNSNYMLKGLLGLQNLAKSIMNPDSYSIFIQDDMQLVRKITNKDIDYLLRLETLSDHPFVYVTFLQSKNHKVGLSDEYYYQIDVNGNYKKSGFSDVCLIYNSKFLKSDFIFENGEVFNSKKAYDDFGLIPISLYPFTAYLPQPNIFRGQNWITPIQKIFDSKRGGFFPFFYLTDQCNNDFLNRKRDIHPGAHNFLAVNKNYETKKLIMPYIYRSIEPINFLEKLVIGLTNKIFRILYRYK